MSDTEVKAVLARAGWAQTEVEAALALLRSGANTGAMFGAPQLLGGAAAMNPAFEVSSQQLSSLLGVDVQIDPTKIRGGFHYPSRRRDPVAFRDFMIKCAVGAAVVIVSIGVTIALGWFFLYFFEIGPYRP